MTPIKLRVLPQQLQASKAPMVLPRCGGDLSQKEVVLWASFCVSVLLLLLLHFTSHISYFTCGLIAVFTGCCGPEILALLLGSNTNRNIVTSSKTGLEFPLPIDLTTQSNMAAKKKVASEQPLHPYTKALKKELLQVANKYHHCVTSINDTETGHVIGFRVCITLPEREDYRAKLNSKDQTPVPSAPKVTRLPLAPPVGIRVADDKVESPATPSAQSQRIDISLNDAIADITSSSTNTPAGKDAVSTQAVSTRKKEGVELTSTSLLTTEPDGKLDVDSAQKSTNATPTTVTVTGVALVLSLIKKANPPAPYSWSCLTEEDRETVTVWNGKIQRTPLRIRCKLDEYKKYTETLLEGLQTIFPEGIKAVDLGTRLRPEVCKVKGKVPLPESLFRILHEIIIRREAVATWHENVRLACVSKEIKSDGDEEFYSDDSMPGIGKRNANHKHFISELKKKQAVLKAYVVRQAMEVAEAKAKLKAKAEEAVDVSEHLGVNLEPEKPIL